MAHESLLTFLEKASQDPALQVQLNGALDAEAVVSVAHAFGCTDVTADQVSSFLAEVASQEPSSGDQELEGVTGGLSKGAKWGIAAGSVVLAGASGLAAGAKAGSDYGFDRGLKVGYAVGQNVGYEVGKWSMEPRPDQIDDNESHVSTSTEKYLPTDF